MHRLLALAEIDGGVQWPGFEPSQVTAKACGALVWYGPRTLGVVSWLWYRDFAKVDGVTAAAFMGLMPLSALGLSYLLLGEPPGGSHLAGLVAVSAG